MRALWFLNAIAQKSLQKDGSMSWWFFPETEEGAGIFMLLDIGLCEAVFSESVGYRVIWVSRYLNAAEVRR